MFPLAEKSKRFINALNMLALIVGGNTIELYIYTSQDQRKEDQLS